MSPFGRKYLTVDNYRLYVTYICALSLFTLLFGCAGIGVFSTDNPVKRSENAEILLQQDRPALAEKLLLQTIQEYSREENPPEDSVAYTHFVLGHLYKHPNYHQGRFTSFFKEQGTYDGTYQKSIDHFLIAQKYYTEAGDTIGAVNSIIGIASAYYLRKDKDNACKYYFKALKYYKSAQSNGRLGTAHYKTLQHKNIGTLLDTVLDKIGC